MSLPSSALPRVPNKLLRKETQRGIWTGNSKTALSSRRMQLLQVQAGRCHQSGDIKAGIVRVGTLGSRKKEERKDTTSLVTTLTPSFCSAQPSPAPGWVCSVVSGSPWQAGPPWATPFVPSQAVPPWAGGDTLRLTHGTILRGSSSIPQLCPQAPQQLPGVSLPGIFGNPSLPQTNLLLFFLVLKGKGWLSAQWDRPLTSTLLSSPGCDTAQRRCHGPHTEIFPKNLHHFQPSPSSSTSSGAVPGAFSCPKLRWEAGRSPGWQSQVPRQCKRLRSLVFTSIWEYSQCSFGFFWFA